jgi:hypothetical protein
MKYKIASFIACLFAIVTVHAQTVPLPPFLKWETNNAPGCKNVFITKDSMVLVVKNKCMSEGILANWRPSVNVSAEKLHFAVPVGSAVQLTITYKFKSVSGDVFSFYGSYDPESDNSNIAFSRSIQMKDNIKSFPESDGYTKAVLLVNFGSESDNPIWKTTTALKGSMNFDFNVTANGGETHQGSVAVIKAIKLEIVK